MDLRSPAQLFSTTLYDRHQSQQPLSFLFLGTALRTTLHRT